jgi:signal-transduction protein with cAMP-binding, CBS, and nucleotidyltransferase domain/PAS domain-containing protein
MPTKHFGKFFLSIVVPSLLAITLFVVTFYVFVIPFFEKNMMERKKEMILELTNTAWSILDENLQLQQNQQISESKAQENAIFQIEQMRYGNERKDYFWIINKEPRMVMHPYRTELNDSLLHKYQDKYGNALFLDAVAIVEAKEEGFIEYYWQWKDDTSRVVPKLSYVKAFNDWDWIIGTGIYLEDVKLEIADLRKKLFRISGLIVFIIILTLVYVVKQSLNLENKRRKAEQNLWLSKQKYKSLVEASTEGTLMLLEGKVIFANLKFLKLYNCPDVQIEGLDFNSIFDISWAEVEAKFTDPNKSVSIETHFKCGNEISKEIVLSVSKINYSGKPGVIVVVRNISQSKQLEKDARKLSAELQDSLQLMNQPIKTFVRDMLTCNISDTIQYAAREMSNKNQKIIFIENNGSLIGAINNTDIKKRVVAENMGALEKVDQIMSAPLVSISTESLLYEAILLFKKRHVSHLLVKDNSGEYIGVISNQECLEMQRNTLSYLIEEIEACHLTDEIKSVYNRVPLIIQALLSSGDSVNINKIITSVADAITKRVIQLAMAKIGEAPCNFAFLIMGSEGRCEQTLKTDQDNAIVYASENENCQRYFLQLGKMVNKELDYIGYKLCDGKNMAGNPKWCQSLPVWKAYFTDWVSSPDPKNILDSSIFFDFRAVFGDHNLSDELRVHVNKQTEHNDLFFYHLSNSIVNYKPTFENNTIDIKKVMLPIVGYLRVYALLQNLFETNSISRLDSLTNREIIDEIRRCEIENIYNFLMLLRIKNQVNKIMRNEPPENIADKKHLSKLELATINKILSEISELQSELSMKFKGAV